MGRAVDELMKVDKDGRKEIAKAEKKGQDPEKKEEIEHNLEKEIRKLDRAREKTLREEQGYRGGAAEIGGKGAQDRSEGILGCD